MASTFYLLSHTCLAMARNPCSIDKPILQQLHLPSSSLMPSACELDEAHAAPQPFVTQGFTSLHLS